MSPTYWTASQIKSAARANGWEFIRCIDGKDPWGMRKDGIEIMIWEDRRGGLTRVTRSCNGSVEGLRSGHSGKLDTVLAWLSDTGVDMVKYNHGMLIETPDELDKLPARSVILCLRVPYQSETRPGAQATLWVRPGVAYRFLSDQLTFPVTLLWSPE